MTDFTIGDRVEFRLHATNEWVKATVIRVCEPEHLLELQLDNARPGSPNPSLSPHHCRKLREDK